MKKIIQVSLCLLIGIVSSEAGLHFGGKCESHNDCQSRHCVPICDSKESACSMPTWFYVRHELKIPSCVTEQYLGSRKASNVAFSRGRRIGHSCHNDNNCETKNCVPTCDDTLTMWRCIEPKSFFASANIETPTCTQMDFVFPKHTESSVEVESSEGERHAKLDIVSHKRLGEVCAQHSDCSSNNCVPVCDSSQPGKGARCIEPSKSFSMHKLPVPKCISRDAMVRFVNNINPNATDELEEIRRKRSLALRGVNV